MSDAGSISFGFSYSQVASDSYAGQVLARLGS